MSRRRTTISVVALLGLTLFAGGCSGDEPLTTPTTPTTLTSAAASSSAGSVLPSASASAPTGILPESALAKVKPYSYSAIPGSEDTIPPEIEQLATYFDGYVGRQIEREGKPRGTVQLLRTKPGVLGDDASGDRVLAEFLKGFSGATTFDKKVVAGTDVLVAKASGSSASVAGWRAGKGGRDLILLLAAPSLSPTDFARGYITA